MSPEQEFLTKVSEAVGPQSGFLPLHEPSFSKRERELVLDCVESGWVSSVGKYVDQFELELASYCGVKRAVAVVNGTAALHICLLLVGVKAGDEVLMPSLTFVASANAANMANASPHFVDIDAKTLGIDPVKLKSYLSEISEIRDGGCYNKATGNRIAAIVPMHALGHPVEMSGLLAVASEFRIPVVEDAAESLGSYYKGKHTGSFGAVSAVSFNGNKIMTTGGGGAILTNDEALADRAKHLTTTAKVPHAYEFVHDERGYNYRMPNLNAALGVAQLEQLNTFLESKRTLAERYEEVFSGSKHFKWIGEPKGATSNYWLCAVAIVDGDKEMLDRILKATNDAGLMVRPLWKPLHQLDIYSECERADLSMTEQVANTVITMPSGVRIVGV